MNVSFCERFKEILRANSLSEFADDQLAGRFERLTLRMLEVNAHMNLTAITDTDGIILKHYADSLVLAGLIPEGASVIDVGCGAGFPSLPLPPSFWLYPPSFALSVTIASCSSFSASSLLRSLAIASWSILCQPYFLIAVKKSGCPL